MNSTFNLRSTLPDIDEIDGTATRMHLVSFLKPTPSKWDDAHKWIANPIVNRQTQVYGGKGVESRNVVRFGYENRQPFMKVVAEVPDQRIEEPDTKQIDTSRAKNQSTRQKFVGWETYPIQDLYGKSMLMVKNSVAESTVSLSQRDSSVAIQTATTFIPSPSAAWSVSMRDMGTEMTPIASQEPSRTGTPIWPATPIRSSTSSRPSSPGRIGPPASPYHQSSSHPIPNKGLSETELQMKTRREIIALGEKLGKLNIAAWASREDDNKSVSTAEQLAESVIKTRTAAWEEAEKAKYMARFKHEEMKIQVWENHQKAKSEAEVTKIEAEVERTRDRARNNLAKKLAALRRKAEEKQVAAEGKKNLQAVRTEQQADRIRKSGRIPSIFGCFNWCSLNWICFNW